MYTNSGLKINQLSILKHTPNCEKALLHASIFPATCNAIRLLRDVNYSDKCLICEEYISKIQ